MPRGRVVSALVDVQKKTFFSASLIVWNICMYAQKYENFFFIHMCKPYQNANIFATNNPDPSATIVPVSKKNYVSPSCRVQGYYRKKDRKTRQYTLFILRWYVLDSGTAKQNK